MIKLQGSLLEYIVDNIDFNDIKAEVIDLLLTYPDGVRDELVNLILFKAMDYIRMALERVFGERDVSVYFENLYIKVYVYQRRKHLGECIKSKKRLKKRDLGPLYSIIMNEYADYCNSCKMKICDILKAIYKVFRLCYIDKLVLIPEVSRAIPLVFLRCYVRVVLEIRYS